jgi:hypothetical protein
MNQKRLVVFIIIFTFSLQTYAKVSTCPQKFPKGAQVSEKVMNSILDSAQSNKSIEYERVNIGSGSNVQIPNSSDSAIVVFAIIGVVVIIAWLPYAITYLYDLGDSDSQYCPWYRLSFKNKSITNTGPNIDVERDAVFSSVQLGVASLNEDYPFLGLITEVGNHRIKDKLLGVITEYNGSYFMAGPSVSLGKPNGDVITLDLMGGFSDHRSVALLGEASFNWNINIYKKATDFSPTINLGFGANYLNIKENEGIIKNINKYSLFLGVGIGVNF